MRFSKNQKMIDMLNNFIDNISHSLSNKSVIKKSKKTFFDNMGTGELAKPMYQKKMSIKKQSFTSPFNTSLNQNNQQTKFNNYNQNNYQMSNTASNNYGQNNFGAKSNYGQSNYGQNNYGQNNYGQGNYGQKNNFTQGNYGQNSFGSTSRMSAAQNSDNLNKPYVQSRTVVNAARITPKTTARQNVNTIPNVNVADQTRNNNDQTQSTVGTQTFANYMQAMNQSSWDKQNKRPKLNVKIFDANGVAIDPKKFTAADKIRYNTKLKTEQENQKKIYNQKYKDYARSFKTQQQNEAKKYAARIAEAKLTGVIPPDLLQYFRG